MKTLLIVTQLDYRYQSNNRTHHLVKQFQERFDRVSVIYRVHTPGKGLKDRLKSLFTLKVEVHREGKVSLTEVDPIFNTGYGLGLSILGIADPYASPPSLLKRMLRRFLSFMGFILELALLPSFAFGYYMKDNGNYDVFIGEGIWAIALGYILKKTGKVKLLVSDDYDYSPGNQPISKFRRWYTEKIEIFLLKRSDIVVSVGEMLARLREEQTGRKAEVIPNGGNYEIFSLAQTRSIHPPSLIYSGSVEAWSGLDIVVKSLVLVKKEIPEIRLTIIGHTTPLYEESLRSLIRECSLEENVRYVGVRPYNELHSYMREADIGMALYMPIPVRKYGFSLKIIEYMSAGLPVITVKGTQSGYVVEKSQAGLSVEYDVAAVAEAVLRLLRDKEFYKRCSYNAINEGMKYDWKRIMERYYSLLNARYETYAKNKECH